MGRLIPTDEEYDLGDARMDEQREERLAAHYDSVIGVGYHVQTSHGAGVVEGYEILNRNGTVITTTKPGPSVAYRYMIKLSPGHHWLTDQPFYFAFDNEVQMLLGQF